MAVATVAKYPAYSPCPTCAAHYAEVDAARQQPPDAEGIRAEADRLADEIEREHFRESPGRPPQHDYRADGSPVEIPCRVCVALNHYRAAALSRSAGREPSEGEKPFPMMDGPAITWKLARTIYETLYKPAYGDQQSLERIAERGGFGWSEIPVFKSALTRRPPTGTGNADKGAR